ncbi:hypothetical protein SRHO_G00333500 [Serrasalmus rhombeus]
MCLPDQAGSVITPGDSGYPLKRWLLTPFPNPQSTEERRYNDVHTLTRSVVERSIGLLKGRWRCLDASASVRTRPPLKARGAPLEASGAPETPLGPGWQSSAEGLLSTPTVLSKKQ